jgi:hypothetical protein
MTGQNLEIQLAEASAAGQFLYHEDVYGRVAALEFLGSLRSKFEHVPLVDLSNPKSVLKLLPAMTQSSEFPLNIISHPGEFAPKNVILHQGFATAVSGENLTYEISTDHQCLGSPLFDTRWRLVAFDTGPRATPLSLDEPAKRGGLLVANASSWLEGAVCNVASQPSPAPLRAATSSPLLGTAPDGGAPREPKELRPEGEVRYQKERAPVPTSEQTPQLGAPRRSEEEAAATPVQSSPSTRCLLM